MCHERNDALIGALGAAADRHRKAGSTAIICLAHLLEALGADVRVVAREGAIVLECSNAGQRLELHREQVEALRPVDDAFGQLDPSSSRH
jgi:hypothetical protein